MSSKRKSKSIVSITSVVVAVLVVAFASRSALGRRGAGTFFAPFVSLWNYCMEGLDGMVRKFQPGELSHKDELLEAQRRIDELEAQICAFADLRLANEELRRLTAMPPPVGWRAVMAEVISRDPERWDERLFVNRGAEDGLVEGAVVLVDGKVFGRVSGFVAGERHKAEVVSVVSSECRFGVAISGSGAVGVLHGAGAKGLSDGQAGFIVDYLPKDLSVSAEDNVITSGLGGWMPAGLEVGEILADGPNGGRVHLPDAARAMVHGVPSAPFGAFHFVSILVPQK